MRMSGTCKFRVAWRRQDGFILNLIRRRHPILKLIYASKIALCAANFTTFAV